MLKVCLPSVKFKSVPPSHRNGPCALRLPWQADSILTILTSPSKLVTSLASFTALVKSVFEVFSKWQSCPAAKQTSKQRILKMGIRKQQMSCAKGLQASKLIEARGEQNAEAFAICNICHVPASASTWNPPC